MKSKAAFRRRKNYNRVTMFFATLVVLAVMVVLWFGGNQLRGESDQKEQHKQVLTEQLEAEERRAAEIEEFRKYTLTKQYAEEVAKDKLGMVHEGEIIFHSE